MEAEGGGGGRELTAYLGQLWITYVYVVLLSPVFYFYLISFNLVFFSALVAISTEVKHNHFVHEI